MASSVALVNKDIARHYQLANLLAPPEAIELTKLYNEMSDILSKPVKFRNNPTQLHLFYDLLSQYSKHFENIKLDGAPKKLPPKHEDKKQPPQTSSEQTPNRPETPRHPETAISMDDTAQFEDAAEADQTVISAAPPIHSSTPKHSSALVPFTQSQKTPKPPTPSISHAQSVKINDKTPIQGAIKMLGLTKNIETPRKILDILKKHDNTFQYFDDAKTIIIRGNQITGQEFLKLLEELRNPNFTGSSSNDILLYTIAEYTQNETEAAKKKLFKQLPGLEKYILAKPSGTRSKVPQTSRKLDMNETAVTTQSSVKPSKLISKSKSKEGSGRSRKTSTIVHWNRWQNHMLKK
jgi:hypothetical protein